MSNDSDLDLLLDDPDLNRSVKDTQNNHDDDDDDDLLGEHSVTSSSSDGDDLFVDPDDEDDDDEPAQRSRTRQEPPKNSDEEEEEEDEDEVVKPAVSPVVLGAVALTVLALGGGAGYVLLKKDGQSEESPVVNTSMPAPSIDDLGKDLSIPSTNLVDGDELKPIDGSNQIAAEAEPAVEALTPAVAPVASATKPEPAPVVNAAVVAVAPVATQGVVEAPRPVTSSISTSEVAMVPPAGGSDPQLSKQDIKQIVADAMKDANSGESEELKNQVESLKKQLSDAKSQSSSPESLEAYRAKVVAEIKENREKKALAKAQESKALIQKAIEGKKRLPGFQVINATADGQISVIKAPSGRTFALFKGERFKAANGAILEVKEIVADGKLVVAGDNWYIDDVVEPIQKSVAQKSTQAVTKPVARKRASEGTVERKPAVSGWSFHASFEGGGYLVKTPGGEYKTVRKGDSESGLGVIFGVDESGNLKTEKGVIKSEM